MTAFTADEIKELRELAAATSWAVEDENSNIPCTTYRRVGIVKTTLSRLLDAAEDYARLSADKTRLLREKEEMATALRLHNEQRGRSFTNACTGESGCWCDVHELERETVARKEAESERDRLRHAIEDIREWASADHVLKFDDGDILLVDYCVQALSKDVEE